MTTKTARKVTSWASKRVSACLATAYDYASRDLPVLVHDVPLTPQQRAQLATLAKLHRS